MNISKSLIAGVAASVAIVALTSAAFAQTVTTSPVPALNAATCSAALDAQNTAIGPAIDALAASAKAVLQTKTTSLKSAVALTDTAARAAAIKAANQAFKQSMATAMTQFQTATKASMEALKTACPGVSGGSMMGPMGGMGMRHGFKNVDSTGKPPHSGFFGTMGGWMHGGKQHIKGEVTQPSNLQ